MLRDPAILDFTLPAPDRAVLQRLAADASLNIKPIVMTSGRFAALRARELGFALDIEEEGIEL